MRLQNSSDSPQSDRIRHEAIFIWLLPTLALCLLSTFASGKDFNDRVDELFSKKIGPDTPGCSVGVIEKGKLIHKRGYGLANLELSVALDGNNVHRIASVSKQFTALSVLLLAEEGKLTLDEDIRSYLPELKDYGTKISINSMLGHFSGMADYDFISNPDNAESAGLNLRSVAGGPFRLGNEDYLSIEEFYNVVKEVPLRHPPYQKWEYSNLAYFLLSMLVEEVSGESLRQYADKRIFKPLGMNQTFFSDLPTEIVVNRASGYRQAEDDRYVTDMTNLFWVGDGGLHTTIDDMFKWDQNFLKPKIGKNPEQIIQRLNTPNSDRDKKEYDVLYANGQFISEQKGRRSFRHSGGWLGVNTFFERFPKQQFSSIVFCNSTELDAEDFAAKISKIYFRLKE